jgi:hypothetical protein
VKAAAILADERVDDAKLALEIHQFRCRLARAEDKGNRPALERGERIGGRLKGVAVRFQEGTVGVGDDQE